MKTIHDHYDLGHRRIERGELFRASGGPYYVDDDGRKHALGERGLFRFEAYVETARSQWIEAVACPPECHRVVLYVGPPRPSTAIPGLFQRPYTIRSIRKEPDMAKKTAAKKTTATTKSKATKKPAADPMTAFAAEVKEKAAKTKPAATKAKTNAGDAEAARAKKAKPANGKLSQIDAAAKVLSESGQPMNCQEMVTAMADKGYWASPGGKTPHATLYSALLREIKSRGKEARFKKVDRGQFTLA